MGGPTHAINNNNDAQALMYFFTSNYMLFMALKLLTRSEDKIAIVLIAANYGFTDAKSFDRRFLISWLSVKMLSRVRNIS